MEQDQTHTTQTFFQDRSVFAADYVPEPAPSRTAPMEQYASNLRPGMIDATPYNAICRTPPGSGKTTCVWALFAEIEEMTDRFIPVYVDCRVDLTPDAISSWIFTKRAGLPPAEEMAELDVTRTVGGLLLERKAVLAICLDDIACLGSRSEINHILCVLLRIHESYRGVKVGVVAIVNDLMYNLSADLDDCVF